MNFEEKIKYNADGLVPAIIQDIEDGTVLMMAWMNKDSLKATMDSKKTNFWSRSRQKYWVKGESSGHTQEVQEVYYDCDADTLLIKVKQHGAACHVGYRSCFYTQVDFDGSEKIIGEKLFNPDDVYGK